MNITKFIGAFFSSRLRVQACVFDKLLNQRESIKERTILNYQLVDWKK